MTLLQVPQSKMEILSKASGTEQNHNVLPPIGNVVYCFSSLPCIHYLWLQRKYWCSSACSQRCWGWRGAVPAGSKLTASKTQQRWNVIKEEKDASTGQVTSTLMLPKLVKRNKLFGGYMSFLDISLPHIDPDFPCPKSCYLTIKNHTELKLMNQFDSQKYKQMHSNKLWHENPGCDLQNILLIRDVHFSWNSIRVCISVVKFLTISNTKNKHLTSCLVVSGAELFACCALGASSITPAMLSTQKTDRYYKALAFCSTNRYTTGWKIKTTARWSAVEMCRDHNNNKKGTYMWHKQFSSIACKDNILALGYWGILGEIGGFWMFS